MRKPNLNVKNVYKQKNFPTRLRRRQLLPNLTNVPLLYVLDLNLSDLLSPMANKNDYHLIRTPGQLFSLTAHLSFRSGGASPCSERAQSPVLNTPEILRDYRSSSYKENSFSLDLNADGASVGVSPPRSADSLLALKRKFDMAVDADADDLDGQSTQFKMPRTGLTEIFQFANLNEDSDIRSVFVSFLIPFSQCELWYRYSIHVIRHLCSSV